jgi:hypothetical protein
VPIDDATPPHGCRMNQFLKALIVVLSVGVLVQIGIRSLRPELPVRADIERGDLVDIPVVSVGDDAKASLFLSDVMPGRCRFVVLASRSCRWCDEMQISWTVRDLNDRLDLPHDWGVFWVLLEEEDLAFFDPAFPTRTYTTPRESRIEHRLRIPGVPSHLVLDREGRMLELSLGGSPPRISAPSAEDCTLAKDAS